MNNINNLDIYLKRMQNGMDDKLWFVKHLNRVDTVVDYGCADGTLLKHIHKIFPEMRLVGVDISNEMLDLAKVNVPDAVFMTVEEFFNSQDDFKNSILILSSVIHEIYSYDKNAENTLYKIMNMGFKEIAIRDMFLSEYNAESLATWRDYSYVVHHGNWKQLADFESVWGHVYSVKNLSHFLLKYRYTDNWDREVKENYFPVYLEEFLKIVPEHYAVEYLEHYCPAYIKECIWNDFSISFKERTHAKIFLSKKAMSY
jgi:ribosomal protein L11 methylase PrmA